MTHPNTQAMIFNIVKGVDYSQTWEDIEYGLGYTFGDYAFQNHEAIELTTQLVKHSWCILNGKIKSNGNL